MAMSYLLSIPNPSTRTISPISVLSMNALCLLSMLFLLTSRLTRLSMRGMSMRLLPVTVASRQSHSMRTAKTPVHPDGTPHCPIGLRMIPTLDSAHPNGYRALRYRCPLLFPEVMGETCEHEQFKKGPGCKKDINDEAGGRARVPLGSHPPTLPCRLHTTHLL